MTRIQELTQRIDDNEKFILFFYIIPLILAPFVSIEQGLSCITEYSKVCTDWGENEHSSAVVSRVN